MMDVPHLGFGGRWMGIGWGGMDAWEACVVWTGVGYDPLSESVVCCVSLMDDGPFISLSIGVGVTEVFV